jgi:hypothetical protein
MLSLGSSLLADTFSGLGLQGLGRPVVGVERLTTFYPSALGAPTWSCMRACSGDLDPTSPIYY